MIGSSPSPAPWQSRGRVASRIDLPLEQDLEQDRTKVSGVEELCSSAMGPQTALAQ